jgi:hypothetical protein
MKKSLKFIPWAMRFIERNMHIMQKIIIAICILILQILVGCAPKYTSSFSSSQQIWDTISVKNELSIRINSSKDFDLITNEYKYENKTVADLFIETITQKLENKKLFNRIYIISGNEIPKTEYLLEINLEYYKKTDWFSRAFLNNHSKIEIYGRLIYLKKDKAILTYSKQRSGKGGIIPGSLNGVADLGVVGGLTTSLFFVRVLRSIISLSPFGTQMFSIGTGLLLAQIVISPFTPGEKKLLKKLTEWSAEDIVMMIEKNINK